MDSISKHIVDEAIDSTTEIGFAALATAVGFPQFALAAPLAKGMILGLWENCYNDYKQRTLSVAEEKKLIQEYTIALQTFHELAEIDGVTALEMNIEPAQIDNAFEVAEHITLEGIRQSERTKVDILGRYYGRSFYKGDSDWQDIHQMITMVGTLTLRQLVAIRLIVEGFKGFEKDLFISNPAACVEINRLKDYGIWRTSGTTFGINESTPISLNYLLPTDYAKQVYSRLMLEKLSDKTLWDTINSLHLTPKGVPLEVLTKEQYDSDITSLYDENGNLHIDGGNAKKIDDDEAQFLYDLYRGK